MTQQPYAPAYPPQYPQQPPAQPYAAPQYPQAPPAQAPYYPPQQTYAQPGYPPQYAPQAPPQQPLAQGTLDDFYSQPSAGSGPGISWSDAQKMPRPVGTTFMGVVVRDVTSSDVQQQTSPQGVPAAFRDGRPKFQMKVPLKQVAMFGPDRQQLPTPEFPEGEATWYVRGQARDELTRAMAEAGCSGAPAAGAVVTITLVNRRPNGGGMQPSNIVAIRYQAPQGGQATEQPPAPPVAPQPPAQQPAQPAQPAQQVQQAPAPPQYAPPVQQPAQPPQAAAYAPPVQYGPPQGVPQQQQQAPQAQPPAPAGFDPEQQALFARITGGQVPGAPAA